MNQNQTRLIVGAIIILVILSVRFFFRNDIQSLLTGGGQQNEQEQASEPINNFPCPLPEEECEFSTIFVTTHEGVEYPQLGHYNVASSSPIFAVFAGEMEVLDTGRLNEKRVTITNGNLMAVYRFIGSLPLNIENGPVERGETIGLLDQRISHFENKYNFVLGIVDTTDNSLKKLEFSEDKRSIRILD